MRELLVVSFAALTLLNCKNKEQKPINSNTPLQEVIAEKAISPIDLGCYVFDDGKNIVSLEIIENTTEIRGNLTYALSEKDKNSGHFTGQLKDNILLLSYTFQSEGKETTRQVAFKVDGKTLIEGYGKLNDDGTTFKDVSNLNFISKMPLAKTNCE